MILSSTKVLGTSAISAGLALLGGLLLAGPGRAAEAEPVAYQQGTGFYATVGLGASWPNHVDGQFDDSRLNDLGFNPNQRDLKYEMDRGFALDAGLGYDFGPVRAELTYIHNAYSIDNIKFGNNWRASSTDGGGQNGVMGSLYLDINTGTRLTPYIGGGLGYLNQSWGNNRLTNKVTGASFVSRQGDVGMLGWQAKLGLAYGINWNADLYAEGVYQGGASFDTDNASWDGVNSWGFKVGARYRFGGPRPAVASQPVARPSAA
ncbi:MAG: outer membrane protein, partial [Prochlorococcaceae cyanobacterium]